MGGEIIHMSGGAISISDKTVAGAGEIIPMGGETVPGAGKIIPI